MRVRELFCALSIQRLEGSRPWLRRMRALWELNEGRGWCGAWPTVWRGARQEITGASYAGRGSERWLGGCGKKGWAEGGGAEVRSARERARDSSWRDWFHAAAMASGGERSWMICSEVSHPMLAISPPQLGQSQRSVAAGAVSWLACGCGVEPSN